MFSKHIHGNLAAVCCTLACVGLLACGSDDGVGPGNAGLVQGFTHCGDFPDGKSKTCQPGQYCYDEGFSSCHSGCLSNINCASDQKCSKGSSNTGTCQSIGPKPTVDQLVRCKAACTKMIKCGLLTVADSSACDGSCQSANSAQRKAIADCADTWSCGALPACLGVECGGKYKCSGGQTCLDGSCL